MTASLPADTIGQAIEISLQPLSGPSAPAKQAARVLQTQDEALQLQKAEVALKDPKNDAEPAMSLAAQEPPAVRALAIGPVNEPVTTPAAEEKSLISARDPSLQKDGVPPLLDTPWLTPDPLPDKEDPTLRGRRRSSRESLNRHSNGSCGSRKHAAGGSCSGADRSNQKRISRLAPHPR